MAPSESSLRDIPEQIAIPWRIALTVSWSGLRRRFLRMLITMCGVVLAIAFLAYILVTDNLTEALVAVNNQDLNVLLQRSGVDILAYGQTDQMMLMLIGLSLLTCLVGIINSMLMSVTERVKEIGTIKCLGSPDEFIVKTFLIESSLQGVIGTCLGMLLGFTVAVSVAIANYGGYVMSHFPALGLLKSLTITLLIGSLISVAASIGPAYMAARKQPVEAMRVEE